MAKWFKIICGSFIGGIFFALAVLRKWGNNVSVDGSGNDAVRDSLQRATDGERKTQERLARAETELQRSEDIVSRIEGGTQRTEELVDEGRDILRRVRERASKDPLSDSD